MWAVRPSRSRTSASQCLGGADTSVVVSGTAEIYGTFAVTPVSRSRERGRPRPDRRAPEESVGATWKNRGHGTACDEAGPSRRLRGAHPRHRYQAGDGVVVPRVRLLRHLLPGA